MQLVRNKYSTGLNFGRKFFIIFGTGNSIVSKGLMDESKTAVLMVFHSIPQAKIVKGLLEANNIKCFLSSESGLFGSFSSAERIKLYVLQSDYHTAKEILSGEFQENAENMENG